MRTFGCFKRKSCSQERKKRYNNVFEYSQIERCLLGVFVRSGDRGLVQVEQGQHQLGEDVRVLQRKTAAVWNGREASTGLLNRIVGVQCCLRGVVVKSGHQGLVHVGKGEYGFLEDVWVL